MPTHLDYVLFCITSCHDGNLFSSHNSMKFRLTPKNLACTKVTLVLHLPRPIHTSGHSNSILFLFPPSFCRSFAFTRGKPPRLRRRRRSRRRTALLLTRSLARPSSTIGEGRARARAREGLRVARSMNGGDRWTTLAGTTLRRWEECGLHARGTVSSKKDNANSASCHFLRLRGPTYQGH